MVMCSEFARNVLPTNLTCYAGRAQGDPRVIERQIQVGKRGEFAVYQALTARGIHVSPPDLQVYKSSRRKSFAPDLTIISTLTPVHVKTQDFESAAKYGLSWSFQPSDPEIFGATANGFVAFCVNANDTVKIVAIVNVQTLHQLNLWRDPKLARLKGLKAVIYFDDLKALAQDLLWDKSVDDTLLRNGASA
jgi:hypothetical protein